MASEQVAVRAGEGASLATPGCTAVRRASPIAPFVDSPRAILGRCVPFVLLGLLAACADYSPRPLAPAASAEAFAARRLDAPELGEAVRAVHADAPWPPPTWDRANLLLVALVRNPQLAVARAEVVATAAKETSAGATPNPDIRLQSEYARDEAHAWLYGIAFDVVLRSPARRRLDVDIAKLDTQSARWQVVERVWTVRHALAGALSDWVGARRRALVLDRLVDAQQRLLDLRQRRVAAGEDAPGDRVAAQSGLLDLEKQRADVRAEQVAAQSALATALGMPPEALDGVQPQWDDWGEPPMIEADALRGARENALLARADLAAAIADYATAEKQLQRAVARQYPEFHLSPGYYWDHGVGKWPLDLSFVPALFNRNEGEIADASAARELAGERMLAVQAGIYSAVAAALRTEGAAAANVRNARERADAAVNLGHQAQLAVRLGASDRTEQLGADATALRAELDVLLARAQWQSARNALEDALHAPLSGPELALRDTLRGAAPDTALADRRPPR